MSRKASPGDSKIILKPLFTLCLVIFISLFKIAGTIKATTLADLPMGSVIQIQGTDTQMCNDESCSTYTNTVLPYKFVKMKARDQTGNEVIRADGTYWMLLDNYCWWGSANCANLGTKSSSLTTWNADSNSSGGYDNNLSSPRTYNVLQQLSNFYNSLPNTIGGSIKTTAVLDNAYDMFSITLAPGTGTTTTGACPVGWTASIKTISSNSYTFSNVTTCTMTSKIGLPSYTDWQGGLYAQGYYSTAVGSSATYCQARFGMADCTNNNSYGLFGQTGSASNPLPGAPWLRSADAGTSIYSWFVLGNSSTFSVNDGLTYNITGISPSFWLSSSLATETKYYSSGTYASPYCLTGDNSCNNVPTLTLNGASNNVTLNTQGAFTLNGIITDLDEGQTIVVKSTINGIEKSMTFTSPINEAQYYLSWTAQELGNGFTGSGATVTVTDDQGASSSQTYTGTLTVNSSAPTYLSALPLGSVVQIKPQSGTMFDGAAPAENYKLMSTGQTNNDGYTYFVMLDNYCAWGSAECKLIDGNSSSFATVWNANSATDQSYDLSQQKTYSITNQINNFYNSLPVTIAGQPKNISIQTHGFDLRSVDFTNWGTCKITANTNFNGVTFDSSNCTMTAKSSPLTYADWQGGLFGEGVYPIDTSIGGAYCLARYGSSCTASTNFFTSSSLKSPFYPWTISAANSIENRVWRKAGVGTTSMNATPDAKSSVGVVLALYLSSNLNTVSGYGTGTYTDPFYLNYCDIPGHQNEFACLPMGSVIQIQGQDAQMCNDMECSTYTDQVLPYKLVKMQARDQKGEVVVNDNNSYWVMLDNYCWWGSANCNHLGSKFSYGSTWNANSTSDYNNNLSVPQNYNILQQLSNFYNSLPDSIAGVSKAAALLDHAYDMFSIASTDGTGTTTTGACPTGWTASNQIINSNSYTFSGSNTCTMTSKIGLPSYTEWQGGLYAVGYYPTTVGSSSTYCNARFGVADCTNSGTYYLFYPLAANSGFPVHSASNPRPFNPWLRTTTVGSSNISWVVYGHYSTYSVDYYITYDHYGVSPSLWLSSELNPPVCGSGTYDDPYKLSEYDCDTAPTLVLDNSTENHFVNIEDDGQGSNQVTFTGSVSDVDNGQSISIKAEFYDDNGNLLFVKNVPFTSDGSFSKTSPLNAEPFSLTLSYTELINYGVDSYTNVKFTVSDTIKSTTVLYTGTLSLTPLNDFIDNIIVSLSLRFSGQIYYPDSVSSTTMVNPGDTYDNYTLLATLDSNHQIWTKELLAHPNAIATSSTTATPSTQIYPFLVRFYEEPSKMGRIELQ